MAKNSAKTKRPHTEEVVIVFKRPIVPDKPTEELGDATKEGRHIHNVLESLGIATFHELHQATGCKYKFSRIVRQVEWAVQKMNWNGSKRKGQYAKLATRRIKK